MARFALIKTTPVLLGMLALTACPSDDVPQDTEGTSSGGEESTTMTPTTTPMMTTTGDTTVDPDSASGTSEGATTEADPCAGVECDPGQECIGGACFDCGVPTCDGGCPDGQTCQCPPDDLCCDVGMCSEPVCPLPPLDGNYADCLDDMGMTSDEPCAGAGCVVDSDSNPTAGVCVAAGCEATCQCPAAPEGSEAPVTCEDVTGDMVNDCWLDCSAGDACPEGMSCFAGFICLWSNNAPVDVPLYGDCVNVPGATCVDGFCVTAPDGGVCTGACADVADCEPVPPTGTATASCSDVTGDMMPECTLDCSGGATCPDGMECFGGFVCIWPEVIPPPPPAPGYEPCTAPGTGCEAGQVCVADMPMGMMDPAWEVCAQEGCTAAADCTAEPPAGGDAPVTCGDPGGVGANVCYLDCSAGQTCPDGMSCSDGTVCAWPNVAPIFEDDFEDGNLTAPAWALYDEDGQTPAMQVNFVTDAWVAFDIDGGNTSAVSTSWYMPAGIADDWMVSPQIMLGNNSWLFWSSRSVDAGFPDILEVYVSTTGNTPADFVAAPVVVANPETETYSNHAVDLSGFAGQGVYIAFRNIGNDGTLLLVDNVSVVDLP